MQPLLLLLQVGVVQYSDTPRLEIPLGKHQSVSELLQAILSVKYMGGNTQASSCSLPSCGPRFEKTTRRLVTAGLSSVRQTGRAIKFAVDHVFPSSQRGGRVKNRIAVVVTDGKSQDDVVNVSRGAVSCSGRVAGEPLQVALA